MDWLVFLVVQGTLKSLIQHHTSKASILRRSAFFTDQLSHPYTLAARARARALRDATSDQTWRPAEFKHISQRRKETNQDSLSNGE